MTGEKFFLEKDLLEKACNEKVWIFSMRQWVEKADGHCKKSIKYWASSESDKKESDNK